MHIKTQMWATNESQLILEDNYKCIVGADPGVINLLMAQTNTIEFIQISTAKHRYMVQMQDAEAVAVEQKHQEA